MIMINRRILQHEDLSHWVPLGFYLDQLESPEYKASFINEHYSAFLISSGLNQGWLSLEDLDMFIQKHLDKNDEQQVKTLHFVWILNKNNSELSTQLAQLFLKNQIHNIFDGYTSIPVDLAKKLIVTEYETYGSIKIGIDSLNQSMVSDVFRGFFLQASLDKLDKLLPQWLRSNDQNRELLAGEMSDEIFLRQLGPEKGQFLSYLTRKK